MRRMIVMAAVFSALGLAAPAAARAAAGPVPPLLGGAGVSVPGGPDRYVTLDSRGRTIVQRIRHGDVADWQMIAGRYGVPGAAYDGSGTGLSADGRTLVLAEVSRRYPPRNTSLLVLDARHLRVDRRIALRGSFTVDAISPNGRRLYLIHYTHPGNALRYEVLAYDIRHQRLSRKPIVDPREPDEKMLGYPVARTMSHDGRWAYTLYQRPQDAPFIHALDTRRGTAACIDLDDLGTADVSNLHIVVPRGGGPLRLDGYGGVQALVDRRTFEVTTPVATGSEPPRRHSAARTEDAGGGPPWAIAGGALGAVLLLAAVAAARRRYDRSASLRNAS